MPVFRRQATVPGARHADRSSSGSRDRSVRPAESDALADMAVEADELRATVYRQARELHEAAAEVVHQRANAQAFGHRRALVAVQAMHEQIAGDPAASDDVRAFAARMASAVARLEP